MKLKDLLVLVEAGGEKAGKLDITHTDADEALNHLKSEIKVRKINTSGKDWKKFLRDFKDNYEVLRSLASEGHAQRKDMPVVGSKQVGELQKRLEKGMLDVIDSETHKYQKAFPHGLTKEQAEKWFEYGLRDGDKTDDITKVTNGQRSVGSLIPIQKQIYAEIPIDMVVSRGIDKAKEYVCSGSMIIVSKDGFIMDGHHRWAAGVLIDPALKVNCAVVDIPKGKLIELLLAYGEALGNKRNE